MILVYRPDGSIHQIFPGFGIISISSGGTILIDDLDTTTCADDVSWKYIEDQIIDTDECGVYLYGASHYPSIPSPPTLQEQINTLVYLMGGS